MNGKGRLLSILISIALILVFAGCSSAKQEATWEQKDTTTQTVENIKDDKTLIVYFTVAENSEVDEISSASVTKVDGESVGMVKAVANMIQNKIGGELFSIQTSTKYPAGINDVIDVAKEEQEKDARPELTTHIENLDVYDTVFIGFPTWWYDLPQAMYSFFDEYDFSGKTIVPFNVHNGSRFSGTIEVIQKLEPNATVFENGFTVGVDNVGESRNDVEDWLKSLGYK